MIQKFFQTYNCEHIDYSVSEVEGKINTLKNNVYTKDKIDEKVKYYVHNICMSGVEVNYGETAGGTPFQKQVTIRCNFIDNNKIKYINLNSFLISLSFRSSSTDLFTNFVINYEDTPLTFDVDYLPIIFTPIGMYSYEAEFHQYVGVCSCISMYAIRSKALPCGQKLTFRLDGNVGSFKDEVRPLWY